MADINPWSAEGWNITAQMDYVRRFGVDRAEARARDAGTRLGGPRPRAAAPTGTVPGYVKTADGPVRYVIINKIAQVAVAPPPSAFFIVQEIHPVIGADMAAVLTRELDLPPAAPAIGFDAAAAVTLELDLPVASASLGFTTAVAALDLQFQPVAPSLGITTAVVVDLISSVNFLASYGLGITTGATLTREVDIPAAPTIGLATAVVVQLGLNLDLAAGSSLGYSTAAVLRLEAQFSAAAALGASMAAALTHSELNLSAPNTVAASMSAILQALAPSFVSTFSLVNTSTSTTSSLSYPTGIQAGDIAIVFDYVSTNATLQTPLAGGWWTQGLSGGTFGARMYVRLLDGTESGSLSFSSQSTFNLAMIVLRPDAAISSMRSIAGVSASGNPSTATATLQESANGAVLPTLAFGLAGNLSGNHATWTNNLTWSGSSGHLDYFVSNDHSALSDHVVSFGGSSSTAISDAVAFSFFSNTLSPTLSQANQAQGFDFQRTSSGTSVNLSYTPAAGDQFVVVLVAYKAAAAAATVTGTGVTFTTRKQAQATVNGNTYTVEVLTAPAWSGAKTLACGFGTTADGMAVAFTVKGVQTNFSNPIDNVTGVPNAAGVSVLTIPQNTNAAQAYIIGAANLVFNVVLKQALGTGVDSGWTAVGSQAIGAASSTWSLRIESQAFSTPNFNNTITPTLDATHDQMLTLFAVAG